jgi:hypothetical protein
VAQGIPHDDALRRMVLAAIVPRFAADAALLERTLREMSLDELPEWRERLAVAERLSS